MAAVYEEIIIYIDEHLKEELTLDKIAEFAGYSTWHIYKIFKIYTAVPVMTYVRRKKLYAAANELYTGRKLYDIALDYGYETPAGFYKAFQRIFGCSPSDYKNNNETRREFMNIEQVKNIEELNKVLDFTRIIYPNARIDIESDEKYSSKWWIGSFEKNPELILYAKEGEKICGIIMGWTDGESVTVAYDGILADYKNKGIHEALFIELENRAKKLGCKGVAVGVSEGKEEFYAKLGYTGSMLVQSEKHSVDELKKYLASLKNKNYEITGTNVYDGYVNQLWLRVSILDKDLKKKYEEELGDCWTQIIVGKSI